MGLEPQKPRVLTVDSVVRELESFQRVHGVSRRIPWPLFLAAVLVKRKVKLMEVSGLF